MSNPHAYPPSRGRRGHCRRDSRQIAEALAGAQVRSAVPYREACSLPSDPNPLAEWGSLPGLQSPPALVDRVEEQDWLAASPASMCRVPEALARQSWQGVEGRKLDETRELSKKTQTMRAEKGEDRFTLRRNVRSAGMGGTRAPRGQGQNPHLSTCLTIFHWTASLAL
jgi:hypothetical protein